MSGPDENSRCPLISVAIPAYNHEKYVEETIRSVLEQDYPRIELIVVDDASSDNTWTVIQSLRAECERVLVRVVFERNASNSGTCVTFNRLRKFASGDFFLPIASDDKLLPGALSRLVEPMLSDSSIGVVVGQNQIMDSESRHCFWDAKRNIVYSEKLATFKTFNEFVQHVSGVREGGREYGDYGAFVWSNHVANGYLIRCSVLEKTSLFVPEAPLEDHWLHLQLSKWTRYKAISDSVFCYRWHGSNTSQQLPRMQWMTYKTLEYERCVLSDLKERKWLDAFEEFEFKRQLLFSFLSFVRCERFQSYKASWIELRFFTLKLKVRRHELLVDDFEKKGVWR